MEDVCTITKTQTLISTYRTSHGVLFAVRIFINSNTTLRNHTIIKIFKLLFCLGFFVRAYVYDQHNHLIAVNKDSKGNFIESFTFPYYKTYGDLHIEVTTAKVTGGINYNVVVKFEKNATMERNKPSCQPRYVSSMSEVMNWEAYKRNVHMELAMVGNTYDLVSIFKTTKPGTVATQQIVLMELDYCFNPAEVMFVCIVYSHNDMLFEKTILNEKFLLKSTRFTFFVL